MPTRLPKLQAEVAALQQALATLAALPDAQRPLLKQLSAKEQQMMALQSAVIQPMGDVVGGDKLGGDKVLRDKIIYQFFGDAPGEQGETLLADYLDTLARDCQQLRLSRLSGRRATGTEQQAMPKLRLQEVYTSLTTDGPAVVVHERQRPVARVRRLLERLQRYDTTRDHRPPEAVREVIVTPTGTAWESHSFTNIAERNYDAVSSQLDTYSPQKILMLRLVRPELALEAMYQHPRLVLLGEPGAGKSTVLRYLALLLARRLRGEGVELAGWPVSDLPIPILCPLGQVAAALAAHQGDGDKALWQLGDVLEGTQGLRAGLRAFLTPALRHGGVLLLFDGLDELPAGAASDGGPRQRVAAAIRRLAAAVQARIVVTSRVLPYLAAASWQMPAEEDWQVRTIQPLAFGQVRTFVRSWYQALVPTDPDLSATTALERAEALSAALDRDERGACWCVHRCS